MSEPDNLVLKLLREMRGEIGDMRQEMATKADLAGVKAELKNDIADVRSEIKSLRADVASDLMEMDKRFSDRISHLNRSVIEYHSSAVGHGLLYSEIDERLRRVEQHLKLLPADPH